MPTRTGLDRITHRAILGMILERLNSSTGLDWIEPISMYVTSDQDKEEYAWLGMSPTLREMIGGRQAKSLRDFGIEIENLDYESTLRVAEKYTRRDKTGQLQIRIDEFAAQADRHWATLISALINTGHQNPCYDGQFFFDTDHGEGDSGTLSNDLQFDAVNVAVPTVTEFQDAVIASVEAMYGFKDDNGEPINEGASNFVVQVPVNYFGIAGKALVNPVTGGGDTNPIANLPGVTITPRVNPRLTASDVFFTFNSDSGVPSFIRQEEVEPELSGLDETSEHFFNHRELTFGLFSSRNAGYGRWQRAVRTQLI